QPNNLRIKARQKPRFDYRLYQGLGSLLAGQKLPPEGRGWLCEAGMAGINWFSSEAFWAAYPSSASDPATTPPPDQEAPTESNVNTAVIPPSSDQTHHSVDEKPINTIETLNQDSPLTLSQAVVNSVRAISAGERFNQRNGGGWYVDDTVWIVAITLSEQLKQHGLPDELSHLLAHRRTLYQALIHQGVALPNGNRPTWKVRVVDENEQYQEV
ncbi:MAG: hypothetical protein GY934_17240, partial [Gammaproteobacteria bacterium]|nr:hypothetical protein [Gammaproteobacteria bacterium]